MSKKMDRKEIVSSQDYKATKIALDWWKSLPLEVRREQEKQPDIIDTYADGVMYGWNNPQWIPVGKELPPRQSALSHCSSNVMAGFFGGAGNYVCGAFYDHKEKKWFDSDDDKPLDADGEYRVTHWMPIVPPRKEE